MDLGGKTPWSWPACLMRRGNQTPRTPTMIAKAKIKADDTMGNYTHAKGLTLPRPLEEE